MARIGAYVCSCNGEIAERIDLGALAAKLRNMPGVAALVEDAELCSERGLALLEQTLADNNLDGVLIAGCMQELYDVTFQPVLARQHVQSSRGANLDLRELSLRRSDRDAKTSAAMDEATSLIAAMSDGAPVAEPIGPTVPRALVIGGGVGGIQAALDIANAGHEVVLVEREPSIGGHMIQLSETFPTLDCSQCILTPKMVEAGNHPNIRLMTYSEVEEIGGVPGRFKVKIRRKARYVLDTCTACGDCVGVCPEVVVDQFNTGMRWRKAIYQPFPQAVPSTYVLDIESCMGLFPIACGKCEEACKPGSIDYDMLDTVEEVEVGAVVVATGFELFSHANISEYGYGKYENVLNGVQFERLLSASGPTMGKVLRPSDGKEPKEVVFIQCVRSRDPKRGVPYCSGICCMYTAKHAMLYKHRVHDGQAYVFYMDIRAGGKGYEEFVQRAQEHEGAVYLRGRVSRVYEDKEEDKIVVRGVDTLTGKIIEIAADMVVLATAIVPNDGWAELAKVIKLDMDDYGFLREAHVKFNPMEGSIPSFFLVGCCQGPKDIPETVIQASGAAAKVCALFSGAPLAEPAVFGEAGRAAGAAAR